MAKLTGLDFPEGYLYTREHVWLRDDGQGRARVGLQFYSIPRGGEVYFAKLPSAGATLTKGRPFGFVDLAGATFELYAPATGKVARVNADLRDDAGLVSREPFAKGWLLDLVDVPRQDLQDLLDRDAALRYYSFLPEVAGRALSAVQRWDRGRPWASVAGLRLGEDLVVRSRLMPIGANEVFTPDWSPGDKWLVEVKYVRPSLARTSDPAGEEVTRRFEHEVMGEEAVGGDDCTAVKVIEVEGSPPQTYRLFYYRTDDFTLAAYDEVLVFDAQSRVRTRNEWGRDGFVKLGRRGDEMIVDHPKMPITCQDETRRSGGGGQPEVAHAIRFRANNTRMECEMKGGGPEGSHDAVSSFQVWERGLPWWSEAIRMKGGREEIRARIVLE